MSDHTFEDAYARVRGRHDDRSWFALSPREITDSIYQEIRAIDRERLTQATMGFSPMALAAE
ncbi:MAG TPA: hypothetical protein DDZ81_24720 [Acetobacteraceae bacterium]|jgi:hypothetical protein|nr:hypothetical protein [Acetobacteraceae bacterium]